MFIMNSMVQKDMYHCMSFKLPFIHGEFILCLTIENSIIQQQQEKAGI